VYLYQKLGSLLILLLFIGPWIPTAERVDEAPAAYVEDPPRLEASEAGVKTVFFVTHADEFDRTLGRVLSYEDGGGLRILRWNYCFQPFRAWGLYFEFAEGWTDGRFAGYLSRFREEGFRNLLYVDLTECDHGYSGRWGDSVLGQTVGSPLDLMSLDPRLSWYGYLRDGMINLTRRFVDDMDGFAVDRLDRCPSLQESVWAAQLLDEVRAASAVTDLRYVMNSMQDAGHQGFLASRAEFVGSDGVPMGEMDGWIARYLELAQYASLKTPYLVPQLDDAAPADSEASYRLMLSENGFVFFDDRELYLGMMDRIFPEAIH
jgi:hypothetical protein